MKALVVYKNDNTAYNMACELNALLLSRRVTTETVAYQNLLDITCPSADLAFVLGGDGTIIHTAIDLAGRNIPIAGINLGQVGFLSTIEPDQLTVYIDKILVQDYTIQNRMIIEASIIRNDKIHQWKALNDIVVKTCTAHPISIVMSLDNKKYTNFRGDGLICATPTGSTAYSYSAGGPIIDLSLAALVITPICPHMANFRSILVSSESELGFELETDCETGLYIDGRKLFSLHLNDYILIKDSGLKAGLIKLGSVTDAERLIFKRKQLQDKSILNSI